MAQFTYTARNAEGGEVKGTLAAPSQKEALVQLRKSGLTPLKVEAKSAKKGFFGGKRDPKPRLKGDDLAVFTRQLSTLLSAGIALMESMEILADQAEDPGFKLCMRRIVENVRGGADFSESLAQFPKVFDNIFVNMIRAGEASGKLDEILNRLAEYQESTNALKREVKSAMTYPTISLVMVGGIALFLILFIVPKFKQLFEDIFEAELPLPTQIVMGISTFIREQLLGIVIFTVIAVVALIQYVKRSPKGRWQWDWLKLHLPVFGQLFLKISISRFARTFGTLLQSGVPILGALEIVSATVGNKLLENDINRSRDAVRQGEPLADPLEKSTVFPLMVTRMIAVGEKTGALEKLLEKISDFYDQQVHAMVKSLTSLIEPLMIGMMGLIVGGIVIAIFLPIFQAPTMIK
jgi:type IV pilus assembly protein PilC